jgi:hypothetical protein
MISPFSRRPAAGPGSVGGQVGRALPRFAGSAVLGAVWVAGAVAGLADAQQLFLDTGAAVLILLTVMSLEADERDPGSNAPEPPG